MYWLIKSKQYDPTPYSRLLRMWHRVIGCPINGCNLHIEYNYQSVKVRFYSLECPCGQAYIYDGD